MNFQQVKRELSGFKSYQVKASQSQGVFIVNGWAEIHKQLDQLSKYQFAQSCCDKIFKLSPSFSLHEDQITISNDAFNAFKYEYNQLNILVDAILAFLNQFIPDDDENVVKIKLPAIDQFKDLNKVINDLDYIFYHSRLFKTDELIPVKGVESGSIIINLLFNSPDALNSFGSFIESCVEVATFIIQAFNFIKQFKTFLEDAAAEKKAKEKVKTDIKQKCREQAKGLSTSIKLNLDDEGINALSISIKKGATMISEGMTVTTSVHMDSKLAQKFPDVEKYPQIEISNEINFLLEENKDGKEA